MSRSEYAGDVINAVQYKPLQVTDAIKWCYTIIPQDMRSARVPGMRRLQTRQVPWSQPKEITGHVTQKRKLQKKTEKDRGVQARLKQRNRA